MLQLSRNSTQRHSRLFRFSFFAFSLIFLNLFFFCSFELHTHSRTRHTHTHSRHTQTHTHTRCHPVARVEERESEGEAEREWARENEEELFFLFGKFDFHCDILYFSYFAYFSDSNSAENQAGPLLLVSMDDGYLFGLLLLLLATRKHGSCSSAPFPAHFLQLLRCLFLGLLRLLQCSSSYVRRFFSFFRFLSFAVYIFFLAFPLLFCTRRECELKIENDREAIDFFCRLFTPYLHRPHPPALRFSVANRLPSC